MNSLFAAALGVQQFCSARGWRSCYIGGVAVQRWGEQRQTKDGNLTLFTGFDRDEEFVDALLQQYPSRRPDGRAFALQNRVLLIQDAAGIPFDIALAGLPFEERTLDRSTPWKLKSGDKLVTCCAEDLVIHKVFAGRGLDWHDVERILQRQREKLDFNLIFEELRPLLELKEEPENEERLRQLMTREGL